jgi:hypothetical protein
MRPAACRPCDLSRAGYASILVCRSILPASSSPACQRSAAPRRPGRAYEIKHDGFRFICRARRRTELAQLLGAAANGIPLCEHIEDTDGTVVFIGRLCRFAST